MSPSFVVDAVAAALLLVFAIWGWRRGAARTLTGLVALVVGLYLATIGFAPLVSLLEGLAPGIDPLVLRAAALLGGGWLLLALASWLIGHLLQRALRALALGGADALLGAGLGVLQGAAVATVATTLALLLGASPLPLPEALDALARAVTASQTASIVQATVYPAIQLLVGGLLPEALDVLLRR